MTLLRSEIKNENTPNTYAVLTLNRPQQKNALSTALRDELEQRLHEIAQDDSLKCAVLTGAGACFSAGFDLKEALQTDLKSFDYRFRDFFDALFRFPKPLVTAVKGFAFAGGFDVALAGDIIIAAEGTKFGHLEVRFGVNPLLSPLWERVGLSKAFEIASLGEVLTVDEAFRIGLVNQVVPHKTFWEHTLAVAETLAQRPLQTLLQLKQIKQNIRLMDYETATYYELTLFRQLADNQEVIKHLQQYVPQMGQNKL